jgi:hypothetical protein
MVMFVVKFVHVGKRKLLPSQYGVQALALPFEQLEGAGVNAERRANELLGLGAEVTVRKAVVVLMTVTVVTVSDEAEVYG